LELSEEKVESHLEEINIHCFRKEIDSKEFVSKIEEISKPANKLDISIFNIPVFINQKTKQLTELDKEIAIKQRQIKQIIKEYGLTIQDLKDLRLNRPLIDKIQELERTLKNVENDKSRLMQELFEIDEKNSKLKPEKTIQKKEIIEVNKKLPSTNPIGIKELSKIADEIFSHPGRNMDVIKLMRERSPIKSNEKDNNINVKDL
jgi:chromosome segregation ATPase